MKISVLILLFAILFSACFQSEKSVDLFELPKTPPILKVTQNARGLWNVTGETLFLNLYDNGVIEFEFLDDEKKLQKQSDAKEVNTLSRTKISTEELKTFTDLLERIEFQKSQNKYERKCCCTDALLDYRVTFQQKDGQQQSISLNNYCSLNEITNPQDKSNPNFPKNLSDLMSLTEKIRARYILKLSSNYSK